MKRKTFRFLLPLIIATSIFLTGCGSNNTQDETVTENDEIETTVSDVSGDEINSEEVSEETEEAVIEETVAELPEDTVEEEEVAEVPEDSTADEPAAVTPAENKPEETVPSVDTPAPVITDPANDPATPTGDIPATVTWTYTAMVANDPYSCTDFSVHYETFTVTTRNPGLHSVEYYQAHPWKLYNENNTDELGNISFLGWAANVQSTPWGELYHAGKTLYMISDDSYLRNFAIRTPSDYYAVEQYQTDNNNNPDF